MEVPANFSGEGPFPGMQMVTFLLCLHMVERGSKLSSVMDGVPGEDAH